MATDRDDDFNKVDSGLRRIEDYVMDLEAQLQACQQRVKDLERGAAQYCTFIDQKGLMDEYENSALEAEEGQDDD